MGQQPSTVGQQDGLDKSHPTTQPLPCEPELDEYLKCLQRTPAKETIQCESIREVYSRCMQEREKRQKESPEESGG
ncbi:hypothetical protein FOZ61_003577 [Perkinsus olseni]|uniref:Uncharacterized protein n=1 Tax=Perkinsus olseni TaxID=32597 RepID=A0A7J6LP09_PEROL|nr:hypothetical protein FOL46_005931 [Perkinsus olseni]KAF4661073.1 hypothetical protein FOZ61_003577 [Perkinsus olseni]